MDIGEVADTGAMVPMMTKGGASVAAAASGGGDEADPGPPPPLVARRHSVQLVTRVNGADHGKAGGPLPAT